MRKVKNWYEQSRAKIKEQYGSDWKLFTGLIAATSAHTSLKGNVCLAKKAYEQIKEGKELTGFMGNHVQAIKSVLVTGRPQGVKCRNFYQNLVGNENCVTVDLWMTRKYLGKDSPTAKQYAQIERRIRAEAKLFGMSPAQYQAEQWVKLRGRSDSFVKFL